MLQSMTGFGKSSGEYLGKKVSVEIRTLNSKTLDLNARIAPSYKELDPQIRSMLSERIIRGKVDFTLTVDSLGTANAVSINRALAKKYFEELNDLRNELALPETDLLPLILRMPEIYESSKGELPEEEQRWLIGLIQEAINHLNEFRAKEGGELAKEFRMRIAEIKAFLDEVPQYEHERIQTVRDRMKKALDEIPTNLDENRFEQELIFYIEKLDISEEKMRLSNHLDYFLETMTTEEAGKKLGFISQEIGREINTLGSKSNHAAMQKLVIGMKDALEKIKEQILNTL